MKCLLLAVAVVVADVVAVCYVLSSKNGGEKMNCGDCVDFFECRDAGDVEEETPSCELFSRARRDYDDDDDDEGNIDDDVDLGNQSWEDYVEANDFEMPGDGE